MPKYLFNVSYSAEGIQGVMKEGAGARVEVAKRLIKQAGGKMECFYFAFGDTDAVVIADFPDNASAAAVATTVGAGGSVALSTTVLLTADEMDAAAGKSLDYRPPGA